MDADVLERAVSAGVRKAERARGDVVRYAASAVMAGAYLTIVGFVFWALREAFGGDPAGRVVSSLFFGVGLSIIVFTATELFTSNTMYLTLSTLAGRTRAVDALRVWGVSWVFNFIGAMLVVGCLAGAGMVSGALSSDHALIVGAWHKIEASGAALFFKGILANWIVCLAVWVSYQLKDDIARLFAILLIVFIFLYLGFEHSIANMGTFSAALLADPQFPLSGALRNLAWTTLGNIVGGGVWMGGAIWFLAGQRVVEGPAIVSSSGVSSYTGR